jgi:two-component system, sensor histidine kinase PdtaS
MTWRERLSRGYRALPTGSKIILALSMALAPLGVIALLASLQTYRAADEQRRSELRLATTEAARKLATELASDAATLRQAIATLDALPADPAVACERTAAALSIRQRSSPVFALFSGGAQAVCGSDQRLVRPYVSLSAEPMNFRRSDDAIDLVLQSAGGTSVALARYSPKTLAVLAQPTAFGRTYRLDLDFDGTTIALPGENPDLRRRTETATVPVGVGGMSLTMTADSAPFGAANALVAFLPLLMWGAAAVTAYFTVDRQLIRPLKVLRSAVISYEPGSSRRMLARTPAIEIRELEDSFTAYADRLAEREHEIEAALRNQVTLTREVHHRVKNNLQVVASLISLHARDAKSPEVVGAQAAIQRRVDALAIVHRNHFAELEANSGIDARALLSELIGNFRSNMRNSGGTAPILLTAAPVTISQDVATPLAFLFTELAEAALLAAPQATVTVSLSRSSQDFARLEIGSPGLRDVLKMGAGSTLRIVDGLARQLRTTLERDEVEGRLALSLPVIGDDFNDA